jgi:hypothetical protein
VATEDAYKEVLRRLDALGQKVEEHEQLITKGGFMPEERGPGVAELSVGKEGLSLKSAELNTVITLFCAIGIAATAAFTWMHMKDADKTSALMVEALHDLTVATRAQTSAQLEQNCLFQYKQEDRSGQNADYCKRQSVR